MNVGNLRSSAAIRARNQKRKHGGWPVVGECELCWSPLRRVAGWFRMCAHCHTLLTGQQCADGHEGSRFPIGSECLRRIPAEYMEAQK